MTKPHLQEEARRLRAEGKSVREITKMLGVSKSSVSLWVRDVSLTYEQKKALHDNLRQKGERNKGARANRELSYEQRTAYQQAGRAKAREQRPLHIAGCMLYWAEGSKSRNRMQFVNSDPYMLLFFMRFLRKELQVPNERIKLRIHCHTSDPAEINRIEQYWTDLLQLPETAIEKTQVKQGSTSRLKVLVNGVCGIKVESTELVQHIFGAIQEYGGFTNEAWLF